MASARTEPAASTAAPQPSNPPAATPGVDEQGFDLVLDRLRGVVAKLEQGNLSLEQSLVAFEEGVRLSRRGSTILDAAEQRVELLIRDEGGGERRQPLAPQNPSSQSQGPGAAQAREPSRDL